MNNTLEGVFGTAIKSYNSFLLELPNWTQVFINFFLLVLLVVAYSVFVWKLYRFISKRNPLGLNLNQYNKFQHSFFSRLIAGLLYFAEYILILPFIILLSFGIFTFFLLILTQNPDISQVLIISAVVIAAIRITAYYKEALSQEISKMLPYTLLAVSVLNPYSFVEAQYLERIITHISQIPQLLGDIKLYLIFIFVLEVILLFFDFVFTLLGINEPFFGNKEDEEKD